MNQPKFNKRNNTIFLAFDSIEINLAFQNWLEAEYLTTNESQWEQQQEKTN